MKFIFYIIAAVTMAVVFSSCAEENDPKSQAKLKSDIKPHVQDVLKGKSKAEVLKTKYKDLKAVCSLNTVKSTRGQFFADLNSDLNSYSSAITPAPPVFDNPLSNPSENSLSYDLKLQQMSDKELTQEVSSKLTTTKHGQTLKVDIILKAINFHESLNLERNKKRYLMKHTPVISYLVEYKLQVTETRTFVGRAEGKIYEKIEGQQNKLASFEDEADQYNFVLECQLERMINSENKDYAQEFENQWTEIDCQAPKNDTEKNICQQ